jgi:endonuclease-8
MSEGPEVHRMADRLRRALAGSRLLRLETRLKKAQAWLAEHPGALDDACFQGVTARGKHLLFRLDGERWLHAHPLMFGKFEIHPPRAALPPDPNVRVHLWTEGAQVRFVRSQVFEIGVGDLLEAFPVLATLGPDIVEEPFDAEEMLRRLRRPERAGLEIGEALLDQMLAAGVGNYLKSEILFACGVWPWRLVRALSDAEQRCLAHAAGELGRRAYRSHTTLPPEAREAPPADEPSGWTGRLWVFRRTGRPCRRCGTPIRQRRQRPGDGRWTYWCPACQPASEAEALPASA